MKLIMLNILEIIQE